MYWSVVEPGTLRSWVNCFPAEPQHTRWNSVKTLHHIYSFIYSCFYSYIYLCLYLFILMTCSDLYISEGLSSFNSIVSPADPGTGGVIWFLLYIHGYYERCGSTVQPIWIASWSSHVVSTGSEASFVIDDVTGPKRYKPRYKLHKKLRGLLDTRSEVSMSIM